MSQANNQEYALDAKDVLMFGEYQPTGTHINSLKVVLNVSTVNMFTSDSLVLRLRNLKSHLVDLDADRVYMDDL